MEPHSEHSKAEGKIQLKDPGARISNFDLGYNVPVIAPLGDGRENLTILLLCNRAHRKFSQD